MLKFVFAGLFILILAGLLQHPVPILDNVEVYSERTIPEKSTKENNEIDEEYNFYLPQASTETPNSEMPDYQLTNNKNQLVSVTPHTY